MRTVKEDGTVAERDERRRLHQLDASDVAQIAQQVLEPRLRRVNGQHGPGQQENLIVVVHGRRTEAAGGQGEELESVAAAHEVVHHGRVIEKQVVQGELGETPERGGAILEQVFEPFPVPEPGALFNFVWGLW